VRAVSRSRAAPSDAFSASAAVGELGARRARRVGARAGELRAQRLELLVRAALVGDHRREVGARGIERRLQRGVRRAPSSARCT